MLSARTRFYQDVTDIASSSADLAPEGACVSIAGGKCWKVSDEGGWREFQGVESWIYPLLKANDA